MMSNEEAMALFRKYRETGDISVRNALIENYMYIAEILAKKFANRGVDYDDLVQIASEGLISGVEKFNPDLGYAFTSFVTPTITGGIRNYFRDYSRSVRVPRKLYALHAKVRGAANTYYQENGVKPTAKQIAEMLGESEENVLEAMEYHAPVSLDATVKNEDGETAAYDFVSDDDARFENFEDRETLRAEISKLSEVEQRVVNLRFVQGKSQADVGREMGVSQMFVSRAEKKIIEKLQGALSDD